MNFNRITKWTLLAAFLLVLNPGQEGLAQIQSDSLIHSELPSFDDAFNTHLEEPYRIMADTMMAHIIPSVDIETIEDRATCLNLDMPLVINKTVCGFIHFFTVRKRNYTQTMLERKNYYFPIFEYYLRKHEMPDALKYLSIVESGLNFKAKSRTGALGLWQFMPGTGKDFYLNQNNLIDERQNPYLATEAACKFLKYLHRLYGDWELALAAYNCGPGNVNKAIKKSGKRGFWEIYNFLPQETRSYVPQFHAVVYAMNFASEHNIFPDIDSMLVTQPLDTFQIAKTFDVFKLEAILGLPLNTLHHANPTLRTHVFPGTLGFHFLIPASHSEIFANNLEKWIDSARVTHIPQISHRSNEANFKWTYFKGIKGESLEKIARKCKTEVSSLKAWNRLAHNKLKKTQKLRVKVYPASESNGNSDSISLENPPFPSNHWVAKSSKSNFHVVEKGEKLFQIAIRYGRTTKELKEINSLSNSRINLGQKIWLDRETKQASQQLEADSNGKVSIEKPGIHKVVSGEGLFSIARLYGLSISQIRSWNKLRSDNLNAGQVLILSDPYDDGATALVSDTVPEKGIVKTKKISNLGSRERKSDISKIYLVQKGDTLYSISRKYTKLTIKDLIRINKLKDKKLKPGQNLIIG